MEIEVDDENPLPPPYGLHFVGVGYNIVDGNPQVGRYGEGIVNMVQAILFLKKSKTDIAKNCFNERIKPI